MSKIEKLSNDQVSEAFTEAFEKVADLNDVTSFDVDVERGVPHTGSVKAIVHVTSMAGELTKNEFEVRADFKDIKVDLYGEDAAFKLSEVVLISSLDYDAVYLVG